MRKAKADVDRGGVDFIFVNAEIDNNKAPGLNYPQHWICYLRDLDIDEGVWYAWDDGHIKFVAYSWGSEYSIDLDEGSFEDGFFGVVTGTP